MANPSLTDDQAREAVAAYREHGSQILAARAIGLSRSAFQNRIRIAHDRGFMLSDGARQSVQSAGLAYGEARGGWKHVYDDDGKKTGTIRWTAPELTVDDYISRLRAAFDGLEPAAPVKTPETVQADMLAFLPHADVHIGMVASADHVGRDYNREIAAQRFKHGISRCIEAQPPCGAAVVLNAGDLLHANDDTDATPRNKHKLKVDGTHHDNFGLSIKLTVYAIDLALSKHGRVIYRGIPGNHDPNIPSPLSYTLQAHYRNEPRVEINVDQSEFWQMNWGNVFFSAHHGHGRSPKDVCAEIPGMWPDEWGKAKEWHYFTGHRHNYQSVQYGPVRHHQLPSVCSLDPHAASAPYTDTAGMMSMTFHKQRGFESLSSVRL